MATGMALVSEQEYLSTNYKPGCDYIDGVIHQKTMPTWKHGMVRDILIMLINQGYRQFRAAAEVTVKIRTGKYFAPDAIVQRRDCIQDPYPTEPVHLCVETLSPDDRIGETFTKCEEYHAWGVATAWMIDPESRQAWEFRAGHRPVVVPAGGSLNADGIRIPVEELFAEI